MNCHALQPLILTNDENCTRPFHRRWTLSDTKFGGERGKVILVIGAEKNGKWECKERRPMLIREIPGVKCNTMEKIFKDVKPGLTVMFRIWLFLIIFHAHWKRFLPIIFWGPCNGDVLSFLKHGIHTGKQTKMKATDIANLIFGPVKWL